MKTTDGRYFVSEEGSPESSVWIERDYVFSGCSDLMPGAWIPSTSRVASFAVYGKALRKANGSNNFREPGILSK